MNIIKFLDEFTTEKLQAPMSSRREMFGQLGTISKKAAMLAVPFGLATAGNKAQAQEVGDVPAIFNLALTLEYLEAEFYMKALESGVLSSNAKARAIYEQISQHEDAHVAFLKQALGSAAIDKPTFDFTAGGNFDPFMEDTSTSVDTAYTQLLILAQAFEDTGVRAYKGQAANLIGQGNLLTAALQIHSVEARHASEIRRLRGLEGWITRNITGIPDLGVQAANEGVALVYEGEQNTTQGGIDVTTLGSGNPFSLDASTQAYDEPMNGETASTIASLFIVS
ncbi:ferritin-like domain-containing protein [Leeuwenhoekiella sp. H156]|uniref:ferritin-like domain-containing protein n=1 Tax=Leeuwenhoekiella sp. H156 TaxID=3450128 RepID=UPI003FA42C38